MDNMQIQADLIGIKTKIVDSTLLAGVLAGVVAFLMAYYPYGVQDRSIVFYSDLFLVSALVLVCIFRKKIGFELKAVIVLVILIGLILTDVYVFGLYSLNKVLIVLIPFYTLFIFNFWKAVALYTFSLAAFLSLGYFGIVQPQEASFVIHRMESFNIWTESAILLSTVAFVVLVFTRNYNRALSGLIKNLETKNMELQKSEKQLESRNASLEKTLEELQFNNEKLTEYAFINSHILRAPLARMLGLANVLTKEIDTKENKELLEKFTSSAQELDEIVSKINNTLENRKELQRGEISDLPKKEK